jgi:hypothetical protein
VPHAVRTSTLVVLLVVLAGCAAPPTRLIEVHVPAPDPYLVRPEGDFPPVAELHAPRPRDWLPDRHLDDIAALSTVVRVTPHRGTTSLVTGPEGAAEVVARFLVDRARHEHARVLVNAYQVDVAPDALAFEALTPCAGGLFAHVPARVALGLVPASRDPSVTFIALDAEQVELKALEQRAHVAGCVKVMGASGHVVTDPVIETVHSGRSTNARVWLSGAGDLLVLDWRQEATRASLDRDAEVAVRNEAGFTSVPVSIPRVHDTSLATRAVLRRGEALVLVQAPVDRDDLRLTIVTWAAAPIP